MPRVLNKHRDAIPDGAVYVGRPSPWGNPFQIDIFGDRQTCIDMYESMLRDFPNAVELAKKELRGKDLVCWCAPLPCHADVLLRIANE